MQKCWSLYNKHEKLRIDDLRLDQVRTILLAIPTSQMAHWYACREGDMQWQSLSDIPDFYEDAREIKGESLAASMPATKAAPQAPRRPLFEDGAVVNEAETTLKMESTRVKERRTARRYVRNLNFQATFNGVKFSCETKDISMNGVGLKTNLPADAPKTFKAKLVLDGATVKFLANRVTDSTLKIVDADAWDLLRNWMVNW
jgi:hypothetical protein